MRRLSVLFTLLAITTLVGCEPPVTAEQLKVFAPTETYPDDVFLDTVSNRKAYVIVAHDDDDCAMSGTIARLTDQGWEVWQLSLTRHLAGNSGSNPAPIICMGNELLLKDGSYRKGLDTMKTPYLPIAYEKIDEQFLREKVANVIIQKVNEFRPSVIFTLDDVKGGYGHPEHIFISQLIKDLYEEGKLNVDRIYQSVYTNSMEREIVDKWLAARMKKWGYPNASDIANKLYGIDGMPEPTVQVSIASVKDKKMEYLMTYDEDVRKNLRKFIPYYEDFDAETYFSIFDREFFRVIDRDTSET